MLYCDTVVMPLLMCNSLHCCTVKNNRHFKIYSIIQIRRGISGFFYSFFNDFTPAEGKIFKRRMEKSTRPEPNAAEGVSGSR